MALNSTMYRFSIDLSDLDQGRYFTISCHVALHPSETVERMWVRLIAYCQHYHERLGFTKGLSTDNEPELWQRSYSDELENWIEVGQPDAKRIKKACSQSQQVWVYSYGGQDVETWWSKAQADCRRHKNLGVVRVAAEPLEQLAVATERSMSLACMIQDQILSFSWADQNLEVPIEVLQAPAA